jgi:hypothetical protein
VRLSCSVEGDARCYHVIAPATAADFNNGLLALGLEDRRYCEYQGGVFSAVEMCAAQEQGVFLLASEFPDAIHDRTFHPAGVALASPELLRVTRMQSKKLLDQLTATSRESAEQAMVLRKMDSFAQMLDVLLPEMVWCFTAPNPEQRLYEICDAFMGSSSQFDITPKEVFAATLRHRALVAERAADYQL